ncbi:glycosyltransferase family 2 protein [Laspinema olomoucense]|uniref:Glycosyltransferase n=1 Tax=Laspinema olomoucense D3b TaxID=2953688 RepID=A0ABT2NFC2_9CYAN|nr:glycosyltransferase [Laspinema sp. D3b]MCT7979956.1 glycosyltransferase [Laspinema sp. D3b]
MSESAADYNAISKIAVSVIIPCYNQGEFVLEAIASVESCQDSVYEILIVNDGSTSPVTQKVLAYLQQKEYQVIDQSNQGLAAARNTGITKARGRYILPLDADNKIKPDYITEAVAILDEHPEVGVVYGNAELFGEKTGIVEVPDFDINRLVAGNYIDACAVFRRTVWQDCGGYDSHIPRKLGYEDWDFWLGAAEKGWQFHHISDVMYEYRLRANSMVSACNIPENRQELFRYICSKHIGLYATNFANIFAQKECERLAEQEKNEEIAATLNKTEVKLAVLRSQLEEAETELQVLRARVQETEALDPRAKIAQLEEEIQELQGELRRSQGENQSLESQILDLQQQLAQSRADFEVQCQEAVRPSQLQQQELEQTRTQVQAQLDALTHQSQQQTAQLQAEWEAQLHERDRIHHQLQSQILQTQATLEQAQQEIAAMHSSKFWKLRTRWFKLKQAFRMTNPVKG